MTAPDIASAEECQINALKAGIGRMQQMMVQAELDGFHRIFRAPIGDMTRVQLTSCYELCRRTIHTRQDKEKIR